MSTKEKGSGFRTAKRKDSAFNKFVETTMSNIHPMDIYEDILGTLKKATWDIFTGILDNILWPGGEGAPKKKDGKTSYSSYYNNKNSQKTSSKASYNTTKTERRKCNYDDIIAGTRVEAEEIRRKLIDTLDEYHTVSVGDLYDAAEIDCPHSYYSYGWTSLDELEIVRVRNGFLISLPPAKSLI